MHLHPIIIRIYLYKSVELFRVTSKLFTFCYLYYIEKTSLYYIEKVVKTKVDISKVRPDYVWLVVFSPFYS